MFIINKRQGGLGRAPGLSGLPGGGQFWSPPFPPLLVQGELYLTYLFMLNLMLAFLQPWRTRASTEFWAAPTHAHLAGLDRLDFTCVGSKKMLL